MTYWSPGPTGGVAARKAQPRSAPSPLSELKYRRKVATRAPKESKTSRWSSVSRWLILFEVWSYQFPRVLFTKAFCTYKTILGPTRMKNGCAF